VTAKFFTDPTSDSQSFKLQIHPLANTEQPTHRLPTTDYRFTARVGKTIVNIKLLISGIKTRIFEILNAENLRMASHFLQTGYIVQLLLNDK
jgi:hypothetical protein